VAFEECEALTKCTVELGIIGEYVGRTCPVFSDDSVQVLEQ